MVESGILEMLSKLGHQDLLLGRKAECLAASLAKPYGAALLEPLVFRACTMPSDTSFRQQSDRCVSPILHILKNAATSLSRTMTESRPLLSAADFSIWWVIEVFEASDGVDS
jgi:hypothetical protein